VLTKKSTCHCGPACVYRQRQALSRDLAYKDFIGFRIKPAFAEAAMRRQARNDISIFFDFLVSPYYLILDFQNRNS
jgi:hypothetical protein